MTSSAPTAPPPAPTRPGVQAGAPVEAVPTIYHEGMPQEGKPEVGLAETSPARHSRWLTVSRGRLRYIAAAALLIYLLIFVRGLSWQWYGIVTATRTAPPVAAVPRAMASQNVPPGAAAPAAAPQAGAKVPLPPTDEPPPRNTTDQYGVRYDAQGIAVMGIDIDPSGVYNVPPGRQLRIGGPDGSLYDVHPGGKITPATQIKVWPN